MKKAVISIAIKIVVIIGLSVNFLGCSNSTGPRDRETSVIRLVAADRVVILEMRGSGELNFNWGDGTVIQTKLFSGDCFRSFQHIYLSGTRRRITINGDITAFYITYVTMTSFDIRNMSSLRDLVCHGNSLESLDVRSNALLERLFCGRNQLTYLNVSNNHLLYILHCEGNLIENLDLSNNVLLENLRISDNRFQSIDVSNNPLLRRICVQGNQFNRDALNNLFDTLPDWSGTNSRGFIEIANNPGTDECDVSIAEAKGWTVITTNAPYEQHLMRSITEIENKLLWRKHEESFN